MSLSAGPEYVSVVSNQSAVMAALVAAIHVFLSAAKTWMAGIADKCTQSAQA
jgi:hypothetical protein